MRKTRNKAFVYNILSNDIAFGSIFFERNYLDVDICAKKERKKAVLSSIQLPPRLHMFTKKTFQIHVKYSQSGFCLQID